MTNKLTGAKVLAKMLDDYGVTDIFHVPAVLRTTMVELEVSTSIRRIHAHGEKSAAYMADGYARASGRPGICAAQIIGALNLAAGLRDAWLAKSPVIALTGGRDQATKFKKAYQEVDDLPAFEPVTKFNATVDSADRFPDMLNQAFRIAVSGSPGPVHLQFKGNEGQVDQESFNENLNSQIDSTFIKVPPYRIKGDPEAIKKGLELLQDAKKPVIVIGGGAKWSSAGDSIAKLADILQIPMVTSLNGKDTLTSNNKLNMGVVGTYSRASANRVVVEADFVLFIGTDLGGMITNFWTTPKIGIPAIQIDTDPEVMGRNYPLKVSILGDAKLTIDEMVERADPGTASSRAEWINKVKGYSDAWYLEYNSLLTSDAVPIRPERICHELSKNLPNDAVVVVDTGHGGMWMGGMYDLKSPKQNYMRSGGHLGWAFPAALGAKSAVPDRPVVCFTGDAGFWYHIGEIETAVRWNINAVIVVNNNRSGNQSKRGFDRVYGGEQTEKAREMWTFGEVNFAKVAESIGALGLRVEKPGDFAPALAKAIDAKRPVIIDVVTDIDALAPLAYTI
ncbi:thiamine pyrophosphate-binding protein [Hyphomicrobiales bacterium]|nr:thiamine pyrophosphate-binding protein [Hyphomicrobiales bacterium]MDC3272709.1 thiamine pyrophosphate-binding protein [Hyphomicrobiales bacterium]